MGEGTVEPPQSLNIGVFNVGGFSTNEVKKGENGKMFLRRLDVCALMADGRVVDKALMDYVL